MGQPDRTPEPQSLSQWRVAASSAFGPLHITTPDPEGFEARASMISVGEVTLYDLESPGHTVERREEDVAPRAASFGKLSLQLEGTCVVEQDGRECVLMPGDLAFYVTQRPYRLHYPGRTRSMVVHFPQSFVHLPPDDVEGVTATRISGDSGLGRVAVPLFEQLAMNFDVLDGPHAGSLVRSALDMLVTVLSSELQRDADASSSATLFRQATDYIDGHLQDVDLSPTSIAKALYVSVRHLHSQFAVNDHSVANYIRSRRLELIRRDLADPRHAEETIQTIGGRHGLPDASQVSRAFRAEYGESPSHFRTRATAVPG